MSKYFWKIVYRNKKLRIYLLVIQYLQVAPLTEQKTILIVTKVKIMNYEKKEMILLTNEENGLYEMQKVCYIYKKIFSTDKNDENTLKLYHKVRDHCHYMGNFRGAAHSICNKTPKKNSIMFHDGSTYDYHLVIKQLAK